MKNLTPQDYAGIDKQYPKPVVAWTAIAILSITYMFSFMDRQILVLLIEPIKQDMQISDTQVSLLTGFSFAIVYTLMGVPMGRAADLWVRKYVIIFGVSIWGLMTVFCGLARSFTQLFVARMGVGFGEAALTPTAYAIVADLFPPHRLAKAMSVFALGGIAVGAGMSLILGGYVIGVVQEIGTITLPLMGEIKAWQAVLALVGCLTLLMLIPLSLMPEPPRHQSGNQQDDDLSFKSVLTYLWQHKAFYLNFFVGMSFVNLYAYGVGSWMPSYFIRLYGWESSVTGMTLGMLYIPAAIIGGLGGGILSDRIYAKGYFGAPLLLKTLAVIALVLLVPASIVWHWMPGKLALLCGVYLATAISTVLSPTIIQLATPNRMRAQMSAIYLLVVNLIGIGFGPTVVALITDYGFGDDLAVGKSIMITAAVACSIGGFLLFKALKPFNQQVEKLTQ